MKSVFFVALAVVSICAVGCGSDGDTEPIKPSTSTNTAAAGGNSSRPADPNPPASVGGRTAEGDKPVGETGSTNVTKF